MLVHAFMVQYKELGNSPGPWDESLFDFGGRPYEDTLPDDRIENYADRTPRFFSIHFRLRYDADMSYDDLRVLAKNHARDVFHRHYPDAPLF